MNEVFDSEDSDLWKKAMVEEMDALDKNEAWNLVQLPAGRKFIGSKWLFKNKLNAEGKVEKYKAFLVEKRYSQLEEIEFGEILSLITNLTYVIIHMSIVVAFDLQVEDGREDNILTWGS